MINTQKALTLFHRLMAPSDRMRVLCLTGESKMGKTHLLTKVFPVLAQHYQACCAILDLRDPTDGIPDILHTACGQLDPQACNNYYLAHDRWVGQSRVRVEQTTLFFSNLSIRSIEDARFRNLDLTIQFAKDLGRLGPNPLMLLFDSVERADEGKRKWLANSLLTHLQKLSHVKIVIAGRSLPEVHPSYSVACDSLKLSAIEDDQAYITYCDAIKATLKVTLEDQSIRDIARLCGYIPGIFADFVAGR